MAKPKIRHLAIYAPDTDKLAAFYVNVFDMEEVLRAGPTGKGPVFLTDGYINLAILPQSPKGEITVGLNHFGFHVEDVNSIMDKLAAEGMEKPVMRPAGRYAEFRGSDLYGNMFDLSEHGFQEDEAAQGKRQAAKKSARADV